MSNPSDILFYCLLAAILTAICLLAFLLSKKGKAHRKSPEQPNAKERNPPAFQPVRNESESSSRNTNLVRAISALNQISSGKSKQTVSETFHYSSVDTMMHAIRRYKRNCAIGQCARCGQAIRRDQKYCGYCAGSYRTLRKAARK